MRRDPASIMRAVELTGDWTGFAEAFVPGEIRADFLASVQRKKKRDPDEFERRVEAKFRCLVWTSQGASLKDAEERLIELGVPEPLAFRIANGKIPEVNQAARERFNEWLKNPSTDRSMDEKIYPLIDSVDDEDADEELSA